MRAESKSSRITSAPPAPPAPRADAQRGPTATAAARTARRPATPSSRAARRPWPRRPPRQLDQRLTLVGRLRQLAVPVAQRPVGQTMLLAIRLLRKPTASPRCHVPAPILSSLSHRSSLLPGTMYLYISPCKVGFTGRLPFNAPTGARTLRRRSPATACFCGSVQNFMGRGLQTPNSALPWMKGSRFLRH